MTYKEHRSVDGHKIGCVIAMKDTDVFLTMGLCNNAASTICDVVQIDPSCDKNSAAAAIVRRVSMHNTSMKMPNHLFDAKNRER